MSKELAVDVKNLTYTYPGDFTALRDINLKVEKGEFLGIIGQNGAGKSTLVKGITGLIKPTKGEIMVLGDNTKEVGIAEMSVKVGMVLQNPDNQLFAQTVEDEVAFGPENLELPEEEIESRVQKALEYVGLEDIRDVFPPSLSKGDRAKVIIASVLAMEPEIIIFDEPTTGQDFRGCHQIVNVARELNEAGHTIIMITHHMALVAEYCSRVLVLCQGEVLMDGPTGEVFGKPEELAKTHIVPPQITVMGNNLWSELGLDGALLKVEKAKEVIRNKVKVET